MLVQPVAVKSHSHGDTCLSKMLDTSYTTIDVWLGRLAEIKHDQEKANGYYITGLSWKFGIDFFRSNSLTGLVRVKHAQGEHHAIPPLLAEAEQLAQQ